MEVKKLEAENQVCFIIIDSRKKALRQKNNRLLVKFSSSQMAEAGIRKIRANRLLEYDPTGWPVVNW